MRSLDEAVAEVEPGGEPRIMRSVLPMGFLLPTLVPSSSSDLKINNSHPRVRGTLIPTDPASAPGRHLPQLTRLRRTVPHCTPSLYRHGHGWEPRVQ